MYLAGDGWLFTEQVNQTLLFLTSSRQARSKFELMATEFCTPP